MATLETSLPVVCLEPNPDISGIGVRVALYIQAFFNIVSVILFSLDTHISVFEHRVLMNTSLNLFISGCALLICTVVQGATFGLSLHHALVVLNLNWIIGLSALLYVFIFAYNHVRAVRFEHDRAHHFGPADITHSILWLIGVSEAHLCGMGAVGVWVWAKNTTFGGQPECNPFTSMRIFGKKFHALDPTLRKVSIAVYAMAATPVVNFLVLLFFALVIIVLLQGFYKLSVKALGLHHPRWRSVVLSGAIAVIVALDIAFIVSTELMISRGCVREGEGQWTYGQTLALVGLSVPLIDTMKMLKLWYRRVGSNERFRRIVEEKVIFPPVRLHRFRPL